MDRSVLALLVALAATFFAPAQAWNYGTATFYGGADASGTMGGACGYGNLYEAGYGTNTAALSSVLFNDGAACGQCYLIMCNSNVSPRSCKGGGAVTVTATNFCPPNWAQPSDSGGWCNPPRPHFDMAQPSFEVIGVYSAGIIPILYQQVKCWRQGGVRITIGGSNFFQLVQFSNVAGSGSIRSVSLKGSKPGSVWVALNRNWGANWQCNSVLFGQSLSFSVTSTGGQTLYMNDVVPASWQIGMAFGTNYNFYY